MKKRFYFKRKISKLIAAALVINSLSIFNAGVLDVKAQNATNVVALASSQVGYHEKASNAYLDEFGANNGSLNYNKYARDIGIANGQPWCATFIWWCMASNGVSQNLYPQSAYVPTIKNWFAQRGQFMYRGTYTPKAGDYIIFGDSDHVGIVEHVSGNYVNTIEGNSSNSVKRHSYRLDSTYIQGYGIMRYNDDFNKPVISDVVVSDVSESGYTISCRVYDESGISFVAFPSWTHANGQDDLDQNWHLPSGYSKGVMDGDVVTFRVNTSQHNNEIGDYATHIYAMDVNGNMTEPVAVDVRVENKPIVQPTPEQTTGDVTDNILDETIEDAMDAATEVVPDNIDESTEEVLDTNADETIQELPTTDVTPDVNEETTDNNIEGSEEGNNVTNNSDELVDESEMATDSDSVTINNITNNNITNNNITNNNITNNYNIVNEGDVYYTVEYPVDEENTTSSVNNISTEVLRDMILQELSNYIPEGFEVTEWDGEETEPECDEIVDDNTEIMQEYTLSEEEQDYPNEYACVDNDFVPTTTQNVTTDDYIEIVENNQLHKDEINVEHNGIDDTDKEHEVNMVDHNTSDIDKNVKDNSEELVMYTSVNGKRYKLTISFK